MGMDEIKEFLGGLGLDMALWCRVTEAQDASFKAKVLAQENRPAGMAYFDGVIHKAHGERVREIEARRAAGGKFIGTFCIYVPDELVLAVEAIPQALCGGTALSIPFAEKTFPRDICPLVKSTLGLALSNSCPYAPVEDLAVGETTCDAKKKTWDVLAEGGGFHVLELPQKKGPKGRELWQAEVRSFKARLEGLTGVSMSAHALGAAVRLMNRKRRALAELHAFRREKNPPVSGLDVLVVTQAALADDTVRFTEHLEALNAELRARVKAGLGVARGRARRIMISGCPSVIGNWKLHHLIESAGGLVVCDETCTGTRYFENLVEEMNGDLDAQLAAVADRYLRIDCSCFTPNDERLENVARLAGEFRVEGVVQYVLQYCHTYHIEAIRVAGVLKEKGISSLEIETDYSEEDTGRLRTRVEAFLESLPG
jgi:benzoyl-CoA reductase/2-hydroxyglutaryl-CoA dehydratase subunit BcrC/BadD/HgdB